MQITSIIPQDGQVDISVDAIIIVDFDEEPDLSTLLSSMYSLTDTANNNAIELSVAKDPQVATRLIFTPQTQLQTNTTYTFMLSNIDILSGQYFKSTNGNNLISGTMVSFTTVTTLPDSEININLDTYYDTTLDVKQPPQIVSAEPSSGILSTNQVVFTYNYNISNIKGDIISTLSKIDGTSITEIVIPQITNSSVAMQLTNFENNAIITISMPEIETEGGTFPAKVYTFVTLLNPSFINIALIKYRLGELIEYVKDVEIYMAILDAYVELEQLLNQPLIGQTVDFGTFTPAIRKFIQATALANIFKTVLAKKVAMAGDSFATQSTQWRIGQVRPETIKFYEDEKKQAMQILQPLIDKKRATIDSAQRGATLLKKKLYRTFETFRWDEDMFFNTDDEYMIL